jgi:hypothetical protein
MFNGKYTTLKRVLENISRDYGYEEQLYIDDAREWAVRAMNLIGVNIADEHVVETFDVQDFKLELPENVKEILGIRSHESKLSLTVSTDLYTISLTDEDPQKINAYKAGNVDTVTLPTYKIVNGYLFFNFREGKIDILYTKYMTDENGCIMIPDEDRYLMAIEAYIVFKIDSKLYRRGLIPRDVKIESEQNWLWYVNSAANKMIMPNYDSAENLSRRAQSMRAARDSQSSGFAALGSPTIKKF